jgi:hypothetical protein
MMSVASCDHVSGTSASFISKTMLPSGFEILLDRFTHVTLENGSCPVTVNFRVTFIPNLAALF